MSSHQMWYKLRNELKWRELQVPSTFMTVGELRGLIIEHLGLPDGETVVLYPEDDLSYESPYPDVKQFPRGSRFRATRTTVEQLAKEAEQRAGPPDGSAPGKSDANDAEEAAKSDAESEDSEFGPDPWDRDAADRWKEKERRNVEQRSAAKKAAQDQITVTIPAPAPSQEATAHIPDSGELPALAYPQQSRELTQHDWEELLKARRKQPSTQNAAPDNTSPHNDATASTDPPLPTSTALVRAEHRAVPTIAPPAPSILQRYPEIQYRCRGFLPQAPVELLYEVFGVGRPMKRADWDKWRAENSERNPPMQRPPKAQSQDGSRDHRSRSHSHRRSYSPLDRAVRARSRTTSRAPRSPSRSPLRPSRRSPGRSPERSPIEFQRWRDPDDPPGPRARGASLEAADEGVQRTLPPSITSRSPMRSPPRSPVRGPPGRVQQRQITSATPDPKRRSGSRALRRTPESPASAPRATAPRRRIFDTQLPPETEASRRGRAAGPAGKPASPRATQHGGRLKSYTPPSHRGRRERNADENDGSRSRRAAAAPAAAKRQRSPQQARSRSRGRGGGGHFDKDALRKRRRRSPVPAQRRRSRSSSSSSSSGSGSSSSQTNSSSSRSRSRSRSHSRARSPAQPRRRNQGGSGGRARAGHSDFARHGGEGGGPRGGAPPHAAAGSRDRDFLVQRSDAKPDANHKDSPDDLRRNQKTFRPAQAHASPTKASSKLSKGRKGLFARAVENLSR